MIEKLNVIEIILITMQSLGGKQKTLHPEDIAQKAHKVSPNTFTWKKYKDQIDLALVKTSLYLAKKRSLISGSEKDGWMLSVKGLELIKQSKNKKSNFKLRGLKEDKKAQDREIIRISNSKVYQQYIIKKFKPSLRQMEEIFRVNLYITGHKRKSIINKTVNLCLPNEDLYKFLIKNKNILMKGDSK